MPYNNRLLTTISAVASSGLGDVTISTASSGYRTFVSGDDGKSFDVTIKEGTAWEVRTGCVYTHSGTTLSRGTLEDSSTGSAVAFTSAATLTATPTAAFFNRVASAALLQTTGADAATSMAVGLLYVVDVSALTADRTYTLPATAAVGDCVGVLASSTSTTKAVILTSASGDTLDGVAGGTEWSRLFLAGELVVFRCIVANATWVIENDGRKFESCRIDTDGTTASHTSLSSTKISSELATVTANAAGIWDSTNKRLTVRRTGKYLIHGHFQMASVASAKIVVAQLFKNGSTNIGGGGTSTTPTAGSYPEADVMLFYEITTIGDYIELFVYNGDSSSRSTNNANVYFEATRIP